MASYATEWVLCCVMFALLLYIALEDYPPYDGVYVYLSSLRANHIVAPYTSGQVYIEDIVERCKFIYYLFYTYLVI